MRTHEGVGLATREECQTRTEKSLELQHNSCGWGKSVAFGLGLQLHGSTLEALNWTPGTSGGGAGFAAYSHRYQERNLKRVNGRIISTLCIPILNENRKDSKQFDSENAEKGDGGLGPQTREFFLVHAWLATLPYYGVSGSFPARPVQKLPASWKTWYF